MISLKPTCFFRVVLILVVAGCNWKESKLQTSDLPSKSARALSAFRDSVFAYTQKNCVGCHERRQAPLFATGDLERAYALSKNYVNFSDVDQSTFVARVTNGHCGISCQTDGKEMREAIVKWWEEGEKDLSGDKPQPLLKTFSIRIPKLSSSKYAELQWNLDRVGPDLDNVRFSLEIQKFDDSNYRIRRPRLLTYSLPLRLVSLGFDLNGRIRHELSHYFTLSRVVGPNSKAILSTRLMLAPIESTEDTLALTFQALERGSVDSCWRGAVFAEHVRPILERKCFRCHQQAGDPAFHRFPMDGSDEELCLEAHERVDPHDPSHSALIQFPYVQILDHPVRVLSESERAQFLEWITEKR